MTLINSITLEVSDIAAADQFYATSFDLGDRLRLRAADAPSTGFRGYTLSLTVSQPGNANAILDSAIAAGATVIKAAEKSFWGYGGVIQAPDGALWKVATSAKKDTAPVTREFDQFVLLLGVADVGASKKFYTEHGIAVSKSYGNKYVEFDTKGSPVGFGLYGHRALAKDAGVPADGSGSHRLAIAGEAGTFVDPDGFAWESAAG